MLLHLGAIRKFSERGQPPRSGATTGALYRHVRSKEQLHDLILDAVLAEIDCQPGPSLTRTGQITVLAHRLRTALEAHPGIAGLLKARDPLTHHTLALAEDKPAPPPSPSSPPPPPANTASTSPQPDTNCTPSCDHSPPTASPPSPPSARTP